MLLHSVNALKAVEDHIPEGINGLSEEQTKMIEGALTFQEATCAEVMSSVQTVNFTLELDDVLNQTVLRKMKQNGFSRIPIVQ